MKYLVVGLGNIGPEYEVTRHNIGFLVLDRLADSKKASFEPDRLGDRTLVRHKGRQLHLLKPSTFMNRSGRSVNYWIQTLKVPLENVLVVVDDIALPFGNLRMRAKGSDAGHNGLKNINETLGTTQYARLRFGIGSEFMTGGQVDYVLSRFTEPEFELLPDKMDKACKMILGFTTQGINRTMSDFND